MTSAGLYAVLFALALVPGLPLGFALFGRRHAGGWIAGGTIGYALTSLALWAPIRLGVPRASFFVAAWVVMTALSALILSLRGPLVALPRWTRRDTLAWAALLLLTAAIAVPPFTRVGAQDAGGNRYYRAYFTADFAWHTALAAEMTKFSTPPRNPYLANRPIHYYWTYFLVPATVAATGPRAVQDVERCLEVNAIGTALLFVSAIFLAAWTAVPRAFAAAGAVALAIVASSAEGFFALWRIWHRGAPWSALRDLNVDALSNWWFYALRVDGLQRCFWWVPQHSMAYALGLVALAIVNATGSGASVATIAIAGLALGGSAMMNPFVGGIFAAAWGLAALVDAVPRADRVARIARHAVAVIPVLLALAWCAGNQMVEGAGGTLEFGLRGDASNAPITGLLLSLGPAFLPALAGLFVAAQHRISAAAVALAALSLAVMYFVRLNVDLSWVGFRGGQMFLVAVPALAARGFATVSLRARRAVVAVAIVGLVAGAPTTVIDAYNAQDITNFGESPNGPWTITITPAEHEALEWLRRATPATAIVQMEPTVRDRRTWTLLPSLAQRRMAAGLPISLLATPEYDEKSAMVKRMYETPNAEEASAIAHRLRIDYIYVDRTERSQYEQGVAKFANAPHLFAPAFSNAEVDIYHVQ